MIALQDWMTSPAAHALGWALIHFLWQGAAIALLLAIALGISRAARTRYLLACGAMAAMVAAFAVTLAICWPPAVPHVHRIASPAPPHRLHLLPLPETARPAAIDTLRPGPPGWFVPVWLGGVSLFYCYSLAAWLAATRLKKRGTVATPLAWQQRLQHLTKELGLRRTVALLESCLIDVPVVIGYLRPVILLPIGVLSGLGAEQVEAILIHELAHIRRYDYLVNVMQTLVEGLLFYHPAVWWAGSVMRSEREHCCDDMVVVLQGDARGYAATLARLELSRGTGRELALAATGGNLMKRIHRLMQQPEGPRLAAPLVSAAVLFATATLAFAAWQSQTQPQTQPQPQNRQQTAPVPAAAPAPAPQPAEHHLVEPSQHPMIEPMPATATPMPAELTVRPSAERIHPLQKAGETPYRKWLNEDVAYVITDAERSAFKQLQTDEEREKFIEQFWLIRDPTPGTIENEFKEEHYRRIAYANEHYSSSIPGWKTDRGRIYITYGPPDEIEDHSAGGAYQRPAAQGGTTTTTYPFQQWRYRYIEGLGTNVVIEFVDPAQSGEYHMTMDPSEKDALLNMSPSSTGLALNIATSPAPGQPASDQRPRGVSVTLPLAPLGHKTRVTGRITTLAGQAVANVIDVINGLQPSYVSQFTLVPGTYHATFIVKDLVTGALERGDLTFQVQ
ncbi:Peptidase M56, BlaR1 [Candidatus Sulfopaludibacter sp. SbA3]|nr:Peptidase M56, BlaR1 [Candidatus Sulfopaludibacter sp. SbA3]